jgi:hypothetical protein
MERLETQGEGEQRVEKQPEKKMRTLRVRRSQPAAKSRKQVVLSRKPRPGEELTGPVANLGSPSRTKVRQPAGMTAGGVSAEESRAVACDTPSSSRPSSIPAKMLTP